MAGLGKSITNTAGKIIWTVVFTFLCLIPFQMYLGARQLFDPEGFFVEVFIFGIGAYFLGGIQIFLLVVLVLILASIWGK